MPHQVSFTALPYVSYEVRYSNNLRDWETLTQISASSQETLQTVAEPTGGQPKGFFTLKPH